MEATAETLEEEMANMSSEHEKVALDHLKAIRAQEETFKQEIQRMQELSSVQAETARGKLAKAHKEKQKIIAKSEKYKEKALKEHSLLRQAQAMLVDSKSENDALVSRLKSEVEHLTSRIREIERSRDILLMGSAGGHPEAGAQRLDSKDKDADDTNGSLLNDSDGPHGARQAELNGYMEKLRSL